MCTSIRVFVLFGIFTKFFLKIIMQSSCKVPQLNVCLGEDGVLNVVISFSHTFPVLVCTFSVRLILCSYRYSLF